jgi:hypothetical protein
MTTAALDELLNYGFVRTHEGATVASGPATIIVVGLPRSGTSMIASVMKALGVFIGQQVDNAVFEDREIAAAIDSGRLDRFTAIAAARDAAHQVWGFKRPEAYKQIEKLCRICRNPRVIVPFRDIVAVALRNKISMQMDTLKQLPQLATEYQALLTAIRRAGVPTLLVSYEKSLQFPTELVTEIAAFCGIEATEVAIGEAAAIIENGNAQYLQSARLQYHGFVGRIVRGALRGWVKVHNRDKPRLTVELELNGQVVQTMRADLYRADVERAGIGDGRYGFAFPITEQMDPDSIVNVRVQHSKIPLKNGGLPLSKYASS